MRKFSSYGPVDTKLHYYVPRQALIDTAVNHLVGEDPTRGGHYITVWAPRQRGKSWILQQAMWQLRRAPRYASFDVLKINLEHLKMTPDVIRTAQAIMRDICEALALPPVEIQQLDDFYTLFRQDFLKQPLILILDEFDALASAAISGLVSVFRNIYNTRREQPDKATGEKSYLLHGLALIGVRSVLGIDNQHGSPFNVQRSMHIPNLSFEEVAAMYHWYERESGQAIETAVIERIYTELRGQPGLTSWFGELLTEAYNEQRPTLTVDDFEVIEATASSLLPNANIINIISKANEEPHCTFLIQLFQSEEKIAFTYDDPSRTDLRLYEAVYHFNLFMWLSRFLERTGGRVHPEFPTGNGQIDLLIRYQTYRYGLEL